MKITQCYDKKDFDRAEDFLDQQTVPSPPVEMNFRFPKGLKHYLDHLSSDHDTWIFETEQDGGLKTLAAGSLIYKQMQIEGKLQNVAVTSFMKIKPEAKATLLWAKHLLPKIHERLIEKKCDYIFSFVFQSLRQQIRDFRQAVKLKDKMPRYFLIRKASFVLIHGRLPWRSHALKSVRVEAAQDKHIPEILAFFEAQHSAKKIKKVWSKEELALLISNRAKLAPREQLYLGLNHHDKVVGLFLPEEINSIREDFMISASPETLSYFQFQRLLAFFRLTNRPPQMKKPVKLLYLSMIDATNQDVFESLLRFVYKKLRHRNEIISYTHYSGNLISKPPTSFLAGVLPMDLYLILPEDKKPPEFLKSYWMAPTPDLESYIF